MPKGDNDRAEDNWEPLIAIADLCGPDWANSARVAYIKILGDCTDDDEAIGVKLLADIKTYLHDQKVDRFSSEQLEKYLGELEDSPWPEFRRGRPISKTGISRLLKPFEVRSKTIRLSAGLTAKGYLLEQFKDAFSRYLPKTPPQNVTSVTLLYLNSGYSDEGFSEPVIQFGMPLSNDFRNHSIEFINGTITDSYFVSFSLTEQNST